MIVELHRPWWMSILLNVRALAIGVIVAIVLVSAFVWAGWDGDGIVTPSQAARIAAGWSAIVALQLLVVCVPVWLVLDKLRLTGWVSAALLGFIAPSVYWILSNNATRDALEGSVVFGLCGAVGGLVVWWSRPRHRPSYSP